MNLQKYHKALIKLGEASRALKEANLFEASKELDEMYELINNVYCEAIEQANEIAQEMKGVANEYDD